MNANFGILPGGQYRARQNSDGTWNVLDVPIFAALSKGTKRAPKDITGDDMRAAVDDHQARFTNDSYIARLNIAHNDGIARPRGVGFFMPRSVRPFSLGGVTQPTLFADLIAVKDDVFRAMDAGDFPYRSVEIKSWEPLQFGALALLDSMPPHFEFPLLTIGEREELAAAFAGIDDDAIALARFSFQGDEMKPDDDEPRADMGADDGPDAASVIKAIKSGKISLKDYEAIEAAMAERRSDAAEEPADEDPLVDVPEGPEASLGADTPTDTMHATQLASLQAEVLAMKRSNRQREQREAREAMFSAEMAKLQADGYHIDDDTAAEMRKVAEHGEAAFSAFVRTFRRVSPIDPPDTLEAWSAPNGAPVPEALARFQHEPEQFAAAKKLHDEWATLPDDKFRSPLASYIERGMRSAEVN